MVCRSHWLHFSSLFQSKTFFGSKSKSHCCDRKFASDMDAPAGIAAGFTQFLGEENPELLLKLESDLTRWCVMTGMDVVELLDMPLPRGSIKEGEGVMIPKDAISGSRLLNLVFEELQTHHKETLNSMMASPDRDDQDTAVVTQVNAAIVMEGQLKPPIVPLGGEIYKIAVSTPEVVMSRFGGPFSLKDGIVRYHVSGLYLSKAFTVTFHR